MDEQYKWKIPKRKESNKELLRILSDIVEKNPDLRFGQILFNYQFIIGDDDDGNMRIIDPFFEESVDTLNRVKYIMSRLCKSL